MKLSLNVLALVTTLLMGVSQAATVTGKANLKGNPPKPSKINMNADPKCKEMSKGEAMSESVVANGNGTVKNVFVYVKTGLEGKKFPTPTTAVTIDQNGCHYVPHVFGIMPGQTLEILNSDPTLHNIHAMPKNSPQFNQGMPMKGMRMTKKFEKPEVMVTVKCDVHPWMRAFVGVTDHPFYSVTDDKGAFSLNDLPAGKYTVAAWHEKLGAQEQTVTVEEGKPANVEFTFTADEKGPAAQAQ